jgi:hypothetical protein
MARIEIVVPDRSEPLVKLTVYMYAKERQTLREQAAHRGMAMSEYVKWLIARDRGEGA